MAAYTRLSPTLTRHHGLGLSVRAQRHHPARQQRCPRSAGIAFYVGIR
jgi:hypothetical protein